MQRLLTGCLILIYAGLLSGCAASNAAEDGVKDHQNHEEYYTPTHTNDGSAMAAKMIAPVVN